jgi:hypothetical protein
VPAGELSDTRRRSGIGRLASRPDLAALVVVFTFGALLNAFAMTAPAGRVEAWIASAAGASSESVALGSVFVLGLLVVPVSLIGAAAAATRVQLPRGTVSIRVVALRYVYALVPLGLGIWAAHYGFHALTGAFTIVPVTQSALADLAGRAIIGEPLWTLAGASPGVVYPVQLGCLLLGTLGSAAVAHRVSTRLNPRNPAPLSVPWVALIVAIGMAATWVLSQPMDMRGVGLPG